MKLVIVESPAKCKKIEGFLGEGYKCVASMGHFREIEGMSKINVSDGFKIQFSEMKDAGRKRAIGAMRKLAASCTEIILATDDDREGEAIAWHICDALHLDVGRTKRILFHEITKSAIQKAIQCPTTVNMNLVRAQQSRQVIDMLVGYKISPVLWKRISYGKSGGALSAGRCQTPALRIVYDNYKDLQEKRKSGDVQKFKVLGYFSSRNIPFQLTRMFDAADAATEFLRATIDPPFAHTFSRTEPKTVSRKPPLPLSTSRIQQLCSNEFSMSPKETMRCCQKLYEAGLITYMRTDSKKYSPEFIGKARASIAKKYGDEYVSPTITSLGLSSGAGSAHESIRPTNILKEWVDGDATTPAAKREHKVYRFIWQITMQSCMSDARYSVLKGYLTCPVSSESPEVRYEYSAEKQVFDGFEKVRPPPKGEVNGENYAFLLNLSENTEMKYKTIRAEGVVARAGAHYTEARLVQLLEEKGIGRPSTFSMLVDKIQDRNYAQKTNIVGDKIMCSQFEITPTSKDIVAQEKEVTVGNEKSKLVIQSLGILVVEYLVEHFGELFDYAYTSQMEDALEEVAAGRQVWTAPCQDVLDKITTLVDGLSTESAKKMEYIFDEHNVFLVSTNGPVVKHTVAGSGKAAGKSSPTVFKAVRKDVDVQRVFAGGYTLEEILEPEKKDADYEQFDGKPVIVKKGKYGHYAVWNNVNISLSSCRLGNRPPENVRMSEIEHLLEARKNGTASAIIREISKEYSFRTNVKGNLYVYHKTPAMKKPGFYRLPKGVTKKNLDTFSDTELLEKLAK